MPKEDGDPIIKKNIKRREERTEKRQHTSILLSSKNFIDMKLMRKSQKFEYQIK